MTLYRPEPKPCRECVQHEGRWWCTENCGSVQPLPAPSKEI